MKYDRVKLQVRNEISKAKTTRDELVRFKNDNIMRIYVGNGLVIEHRTFRRTGLRYEFTFRNFREDGGEDFATKKRYKSINRLLHDLKIYEKNLQRMYSRYVCLEKKT